MAEQVVSTGDEMGCYRSMRGGGLGGGYRGQLSLSVYKMVPVCERV